MTAVSFSRGSIQLAVVVLVAVPITACASGRSNSTGLPIVLPAAERVLLAEDFNDYDPHWRQVRGQWALVGGNLLQARDDARELNTMMFYDPLTVADADITTEVSVMTDLPQHLTAGDDELLTSKRRVAGAGVVFRYQDEHNFYLFRTAGEEGVVLGKVVDGEWHELANPRAVDFAGVRLQSETPYRLRVRVVGSRIQAWIGDKAVANVEDSSLGTGRIGLATFRAKAAFTALRVVER
jgi:pectate lyase